MASLLTLKVGDIISSTGGWADYYQVVGWPDDPNDDHIQLKDLRSDGGLGRHPLPYNKSSLLVKNWVMVSSGDERLISSVGRHLALLRAEAVSEVQELLFKLEI